MDIETAISDITAAGLGKRLSVDLLRSFYETIETHTTGDRVFIYELKKQLPDRQKEMVEDAVNYLELCGLIGKDNFGRYFIIS